MPSFSSSKSSIIKSIYFYSVSLIALMMIVFSTVDLINIGLKTWIFTKADQPGYIQPCDVAAVPSSPAKDGQAADIQTQLAVCEANTKQQLEQYQTQKQSDAVRDLAFLVVGIPVFAYHWTTIRKEQKEERSPS